MGIEISAGRNRSGDIERPFSKSTRFPDKQGRDF